MQVLADTRMKNVDDHYHHLQARGNSAIATPTVYNTFALHSSMTDLLFSYYFRTVHLINELWVYVGVFMGVIVHFT